MDYAVFCKTFLASRAYGMLSALLSSVIAINAPDSSSSSDPSLEIALIELSCFAPVPESFQIRLPNWRLRKHLCVLPSCLCILQG